MSITGDLACKRSLNRLRHALIEAAKERSLFRAKSVLAEPCEHFLRCSVDREHMKIEELRGTVRAIQHLLNQPEPKAILDVTEGLKEWALTIEMFEREFKLL